jgi:hypothetical protein
MKTIIFTLFLTFLGEFIYAQAVGDYQSKTSGNWNDIATWQTYDGTTFIDATTTPTSASGVVKILNGHTVTINAAVTIDQVVVEAGGTLTQTATVTLNDGSGDDLTVNGTWNWSFGIGNTARNGIIVIGNSGIVNINGGNLTTNLTNNGTFNWGGTGSIHISGSFFSPIPITITNNGTFNISGNPSAGNYIGDPFAPSNSSFINNGTINKNNTNNPSGGASSTMIFTGGTTTNSGTINISEGRLEMRGGRLHNNNSIVFSNLAILAFSSSNFENFINSSISGSGIITFATSTLAVATTNLTIPNTIIPILSSSTISISSNRTMFLNKSMSILGTNTISGAGTLNISNLGGLEGDGTTTLSVTNFVNSGIVKPAIDGSSISPLTINTQQPLSANTTLNIRVKNNLGAGRGHGQLARAGNLTLAGTLTVSEVGTPPSGSYTIVNLTSGTISGSFSTVNLPAGYSIQVNSTNIVITKAAGPCDTAITLQSPANDISTGTITHQTNNTITASNKITGSANVTYRSNKSIMLTSDTNGFTVANGVVFKAEIGGCN